MTPSSSKTGAKSRDRATGKKDPAVAKRHVATKTPPREPSAQDGRYSAKGDVRRTAIIQAGYRVVQASGIAGLTFRAVAQEAGVPLGSTSYYFADKNLLLVEIVRFARERIFDHYAKLAAETGAGKSWIDVLAAHVEWVTTEDHKALVRDYEMFLYGFETEELIELSRGWIFYSNPIFTQIVPADVAASVSYLLEGVFLTAAKTGKMFSASEIAALLHRLAGEPLPPP